MGAPALRPPSPPQSARSSSPPPAVTVATATAAAQRLTPRSFSAQAHLEYYRGGFVTSKRLYEDANTSARERGDKQMLNRCNAGIAANLIVMGDTGGVEYRSENRSGTVAKP